MIFYLGTDNPAHLARTAVPLFVSHRRLRFRRTLPRAAGPWALDSGGFSELSLHGAWTESPHAYIAAIRRYQSEIGNLAWCAPQDWMCEPFMTHKTGLSVIEHQRRTIDNYVTLRDAAPELPIIPVLQGWDISDYQRHVDAYARAGVDLWTTLVGVGSVCRRQHMTAATQVLAPLAGLGLRLHGFGFKRGGLRQNALLLESADSMAWSYGARRQQIKLSTCTHVGRTCSHCLRYALQWRDAVLHDCAANTSSQLAFCLEAA